MLQSPPELDALKEEGGVLVVDKPIEWSSLDAVKKIKYNLKIKKIGHAGTLDPLATGVLVMCTGQQTKAISGIQEQEKEYLAKVQLGATTRSFDSETEPENPKPTDHLTQEKIEQALEEFRGDIRQIPPSYSAVKIKGKRAYKMARKGEDVDLHPRLVTLHELELMAWNPQAAELDLRVVCSKGTYIRSLAHDIGQALQCGGYLKGLVRTRVGEYRLETARTPQEWVDVYKKDK